MRKRLPKILITGGAGFIGSAFARLVIQKGYPVIILDKLAYAADLERLAEVKGKFRFCKFDICDKKQIEGIIAREIPEIIVNFAAQTHVDRSILDPFVFIKTNVLGTQTLLEASRKAGIKKFIHISTDEIYGEAKRGSFRETSGLFPNSPYAASKAAADLLIRSYIRTYDFPAIIIRPCNNYGPWQYPEKFIPYSILRLLKGRKIPLYGNGRNIREWLNVGDCAKGIFGVMSKGKTGQVYNLGSARTLNNRQIAGLILKLMQKNPNCLEFVPDRPGHDLRYRLDSRKVFLETGWKAQTKLEDGLKEYIDWCLKHRKWLFAKYKSVSKLYNR